MLIEPFGSDTSKVLEAPETPAPVFAIHAFKSALFGTPGAEEEHETGPTSMAASQPKPGHQRSRSDTVNPIPIDSKEDAKLELDLTINPSGSPTKSILVTPGTISNRRKTVSFGEGVVDNEGKRDSQSSRAVKTPPNPSGSLSAQWMSGSADGKPRSKLTQTLMDARDNASKNAESAKSNSETSDSKSPTKRLQLKEETSMEDITTNLEEPRSESGKYWKTEFDNYRVRTNREIKKLIHYRSIAKSYARKKDSEALRLADKLKEEEEKVVEMERQVTRLASTIAGEGSKANKEQLIQDLAKQTTMALQYKQEVTSLRNLLNEDPGVIEGGKSNDITKERQFDEKSTNSSEELRQTQEELKRANAKIEEMKHQHLDLGKLESLAQSSEKKAQELEKENHTLKQTLARVKQEMSRYEGRRKEKETRLKQREAKLEARVQEYRERLKKLTQEHRDSEETVRNNFNEERRRMQSQIELLKTRVSAAECSVPTLRPQQRNSLSPRKEYTGVQVHDFAAQDHPEIDEEVTEEIETPPSPSPRSKSRELRPALHGSATTLELKRASRDIPADDDEVTHYLNEILPQHGSHRFNLDPVPPSSPPELSALKSLGRNTTKYLNTGENRTYRSLYRRDRGTVEGYSHGTHRPRAHIKSTLDSISARPSSRPGVYAGYTIAGGERTTRRTALPDVNKEFPNRELLSPERLAAAQSRILQRQNSQKMKALGKENRRTIASLGADRD
ncbi:hypothetical protein N7462_003490 [Penicillium macrosclerotiorum]|uniref:uncharacterized protein n=1 Tax=Penicillium macrosclerotiorum TaxID=303699 RepID=UPI00254929C7|nr:uncharacterized protein N7462_003490 [Penicillium macrosclerotiorum]KAJ5689098.1 hypothetical protein N7462_003490 [Penicillium macrosclerotiorum]